MTENRISRLSSWTVVAVGFCLLLASSNALCQSTPGWGRISLFSQFGQQRTTTGEGYRTSELAASITLHSAQSENGGFEYAVDTRSYSYPSGQQDGRVAVYDAYIGMRSASGWGARLGQMWLNELGGLGSLGGLHLEYRQQARPEHGRFRAGLFLGVEPKAFEAGFATGVKKGGIYAAYDGSGARRHVLGYVTIRNRDLVERSTLTMTNFIPTKDNSFFLYQAAEYDLQGQAGQGKAGLSYFFATARYAPTRAVELQASFHHGLSVDARSITNDQLNGRPVNPSLLQGFLFESAGGRVSFQVAKGVRLWVGYGRDRNSREELPQTRSSAGFYASNLFGSGFDVTANGSQVDREAGPYHSWYASVGRPIGQRVYLSVDYTTSLSVLRTTGSGGVIVESRPETERYSASANVNLSRAFSLLLTYEQLVDGESREDRALVGLTYRF